MLFCMRRDLAPVIENGKCYLLHGYFVFFYRQHLTCYIAVTNIKLIVIMWSLVKIMAEVIPLLPILEMQRDRTCLQFIPVYSLPY